MATRQTGTVADVVTHIANGGYLRLPEAIVRREHDADHFDVAAGEELPDRVAITRSLRAIPYREVIALDQFIDGHTPFATKHSVKGDEFENVLVVLGRGWNKYNFDQYLVWAGSGNVPAGKQEARLPLARGWPFFPATPLPHGLRASVTGEKCVAASPDRTISATASHDQRSCVSCQISMPKKLAKMTVL